MKIFDEPVSMLTIKKMAEVGFGEMVKAVVDIDKNIMAVDMELHADGEAELLKTGSKQSDLWGINIYPEAPKGEMIEYRSMINVRPMSGNNSLRVEDPQIQKRIEQVVNKLIVNNA